jgi:hypothetical protein
MQTLDAMLRIEKMMAKTIAYFEAQGATVTRVEDEVQIELPTPSTKRRNPRSL